MTAADSSLEAELAHVYRTCLVSEARRTANRLTRFYNAHLASLGLEITQFILLGTIASGQPRSAVELARRLELERSTLARNIERLKAAGLVTAEAGDGRRLCYHVTPLGKSRLAAALEHWNAAQGAILNRLPAGADAAARAELVRLRETVEAIERSPEH